MANRDSTFVSGNLYDKYATGNPLYRRLMSGFLSELRRLLAAAAPESVLEVGCGPGDLAVRILDGSARQPRYVGSDLSLDEVVAARTRLAAPHVVASADALPFSDGSFDLVLACEVLEHLPQPALAVAEASRVARSHLLASVPWEPVWRLLNLARGSYWSRGGNTPGHLQSFTRRGFRGLVSTHFEPITERRPFPWTILLARRRVD